MGFSISFAYRSSFLIICSALWLQTHAGKIEKGGLLRELFLLLLHRPEQSSGDEDTCVQSSFTLAQGGCSKRAAACRGTDEGLQGQSAALADAAVGTTSVPALSECC